MARGTHKKPPSPASEALWATRKEEILTQAATLFAQHGYSETDTQLLAETIGVGKGTVYRYFPSKRELFLAATDRVMRMMRERIDARVEGVEDPLARIQSGVHEFLSFFAEYPEFVELLMQERALFKDRKRPTFIEHRLMNLERWREMYRELIAAGRVREISPEGITEVVGNLLYGTIFMNYFSGQRTSPETQSADLINILFGGILTAEERARQAGGGCCPQTARTPEAQADSQESRETN
jgi:AcrR family transcriptional regulator